MNCDECGGSIAVERGAVRRYDIGGLPHVELRGVEVEKCEQCGHESIAIPRIGQLHSVLARLMANQPRMISPVEIRFLRKHVGLSTAGFAKIMGVARETVSRWENGSQPMGAVADRLLRMIVLSHQPADSYAVEDLLRSLNDTPALEHPSDVEVCNDERAGWIHPMTQRHLAGA